MYKDVLNKIKYNDYNFICHYITEVSNIHVINKETFPEFLLFKECNNLAWLTYQIGNLSEDFYNKEATNIKYTVMSLCVAMTE